MALQVLVYSDDRNTREQILLALGKRPAADLAELQYLECATAPAVVKALDAHAKGTRRLDLLVLDGEATPIGGMGLCRQLKDEIYGCPPVLVVIGRPQDSWLATWSRADAAIAAPVDPVALAETAIALLRSGHSHLVG
jgi:DNA-binding response OmpR family regulator